MKFLNIFLILKLLSKSIYDYQRIIYNVMVLFQLQGYNNYSSSKIYTETFAAENQVQCILNIAI